MPEDNVQTPAGVPPGVSGGPSATPSAPAAVSDPGIVAWVSQAEARLAAFLADAETRVAAALAQIAPATDAALANLEPMVKADLEEARTSLAPLISRGRDLVAQMESLAKTDVSAFSSRLRALEGAVFSVAGPILGSAEHDAHGMLQTFFDDVKKLFIKPPASAATPSPSTAPSAAGSEPAASK